MVQQTTDPKIKGFAALAEAEKKYERERSKPVVKGKGSRKAVKKGDEYYEW